MRFLVYILILFTIASPAFAVLGFRVGGGQFVPQDSIVKEAYANAYMADIRYSLHEPFFVSGGALLYNVHNSLIPITLSGSTDITVGAYKIRLDGFGAFAGVGVGKLLGKAGTGVSPYACAAVGFISPVISQRFEYYVEGDTTSTFYDVKEDRNWAFLATPYVGVEVRFAGIGVFVQGNYLWGNCVDYEAHEVNGIEVLPAGSITPSGWILYVGVVID